MKWRDWLVDYSRGDNLGLFWRLFEWRSHTRHKWLRDIQSLLLGRIAHRHGGYIGVETKFDGRPRLPHGLHGVFQQVQDLPPDGVGQGLQCMLQTHRCTTSFLPIN